MKLVIMMMFMAVFSCAAFAVESSLTPVETFMGKYYWIMGGLILLWEYLVGISKIRQSSTIEVIVDFIKKFNPKK